MPTEERRFGDWLTAANAVSLARLVAAPYSLVVALEQRWLLASIIFVAAVVSDMLDGYLARRAGKESALGGLLDHSADAIYVTLTLWALAHTGVIPGFLPFLIGCAFLQYVLDSRAMKGERLRTSQLGRWNGIAYFVLVGVIVIRNALGLAWLPDDAIWLFGLVLLTTTFLSMFERLHAMMNPDSAPLYATWWNRIRALRPGKETQK